MPTTPAASNILTLFASVGLVALTIYLLIVGEDILIPLVLAIFISYLITALSRRIERLKVGAWHPPRWLGTTSSILLVVLVIAVMVQLMAGNIRAVVAEAPEYQERLQAAFTSATTFVANLLNQDEPLTFTTLVQEINIRAVLERVVNSFQSIAGNTFQMIVYVAFLLLERRYLDRKMAALCPEPARLAAVQATLQEIGSKIETYVLIKTGISLLNAILSYGILLFLGVDFAGFWALLVFALNYIPYIGSPIAMAFPTLMALLQFGSLVTALTVFASLFLIQAFVENVIEPRITGRTLNLSPIVMIVALSVWGAIWGITGMILSVPLMVMIMIILAQFPRTRPIAVFMSERGEVT